MNSKIYQYQTLPQGSHDGYGAGMDAGAYSAACSQSPQTLHLCSKGNTSILQLSFYACAGISPIRLSYRNLRDMMAECGIDLAHTTILRWVKRYVPEAEIRQSGFMQRVTVDFAIVILDDMHP
jgi:hypothetical protein